MSKSFRSSTQNLQDAFTQIVDEKQATDSSIIGRVGSSN